MSFLLPSSLSKPRWVTGKHHPNFWYQRSTFANRRFELLRIERSVTSTSISHPTAMTNRSSPATAGQTVQRNGEEYELVKEGLAYILKPTLKETPSDPHKKIPESESQQNSVFYNPIQQFNRDLSVLAIKAYGEHVLSLGSQMVKKKRKRKRKRGDQGGDLASDQISPTNKDSGIVPTFAQDAATADSGFSQAFRILDALSATGLRALRYAKEIPFVTTIVANDLSGSAIRSMKLNIDHNGVEKLVHPHNGDARTYMYSLLEPHKPISENPYIGKFDVIDLDPYGSAAPFMDAAVQGINDGGLLCVTCTDAGVFASTMHSEKAFASYGGLPLKGELSHEGGLRLILNGISASAAKYGLAIEPLLSLSIDFYARIFVRIHRSPAEVKFTSGNTMLVYNCDAGCGAWRIQPLAQTKQRPDRKGKIANHFGLAQGPVSTPTCEHCGFKTHLGGPMWAGPLHNPHFIQKILDMLPVIDRETYQTVDRMKGMLITALEEDLDLAASSNETTPDPDSSADDGAQLPAIIPRTNPALREHHPFLFCLGAIAKVLHTQTVSFEVFRSALRHLGYRSTRSHTKPNSIRTDAPWDVIWEIMREWVRQKAPIKKDALRVGSAGATIMQKSRDAPKISQDDLWLSLLQREIRAALASSQDVHDLKTKIEAALYRSSSRLLTSELNPSVDDAGDLSDNGTSDHEEGPQAGETSNSAPVAKLRPNTLNIVFDETRKASSSQRKIMRYQVNPRPNWGPISRASGA
jgi:tRNA (guanine26-N2/guanine27-N2)-dimethyltransferase